MQRYVWRVLCPVTNEYETVIDDIEPTVCPSDGVTPVDPAFTTIMQSEFYDVVSSGYVNIESQLADNQALKIIASDANGGIDITAGFGGIEVNTTNAISLNAQAASNLTTTAGNLTLLATTGLLNIDSGSGLNIGNASGTNPINIGSVFTKNINIGNNTGATSVTMRSGTGGLVVNSSSVASDAIHLFSSGGIKAEASGLFAIVSSNSTVSAISFDATFGGGGIVLASGAQGIILTSNGGPIALGSWSGGDIFIGTAAIGRSILMGNTTGATSIGLNSGTGGIILSSNGSIILSSNGNPIGIGSWSGGDIYLGTAAIARTITIGNATTTTSVVISSGTGGITIGNDANGGPVQIASTASAKVITVGNSTGASRLFTRYGTGGLIKHQEPHVSLANADSTITIANILSSILTIIPTINRTITLPTAANAVAGIAGIQVNDCVDFVIINESTPLSEAFITIVAGVGGIIEGNNSIAPKQNSLGSFFTSGSATYRLRFTNVTTGTEAYILYRIS